MCIYQTVYRTTLEIEIDADTASNTNRKADIETNGRKKRHKYTKIQRLTDKPKDKRE